MKHFLSVKDCSNPHQLAEEALQLKKSPFAFSQLGAQKTLGLLFFNPSLRTRLSTQKAASQLGLPTLSLDFAGQAWTLEMQEGTIMNGNSAEHIKDAAAVIGSYCDLIAIRCFPSLNDREADYQEQVLSKLVKYAGVPIINLESATVHPLQSLADLMTIKTLQKKEKPKVVLSWAPHPKALPQAVANSFAEWMLAADYDLCITHPPGYELASRFAPPSLIEYDQEKAFAEADFIYAKNWSSYQEYGKCLSVEKDWQITAAKMALTNQGKFMHCLPVRRNVVVSDAVMDGGNAVVLEQAANRVYAAQAVLKQLLFAM